MENIQNEVQRGKKVEIQKRRKSTKNIWTESKGLIEKS